MKTESFVRALAGTMILASLLLAHFASPWWLLLTAFVALNLIQSAFTGFCPPTWLLDKLHWVDASGRIHWGKRQPPAHS